MMYNFFGLLVRIGYTLLFPLRIIGKQYLPAGGAYILAPNHLFWYDPLTVAKLVLPKRIHYMAKAELFEKKLLGRFLRSLHAYPVRRGTADIGAIKTSLKLIRSGEILGIFPEGTRNRSGEGLLEAHRGAATLALRTGIPIVPVRIAGKLRLFARTRVVVSPPLYPDRYEDTQEMSAAQRMTHDLIEALGH